MAVWWWALPMLLLACHSFRTHTFAPPAMLIEETGPQMLFFVLEHGLSFQHPCAAACSVRPTGPRHELDEPLRTDSRSFTASCNLGGCSN